MPSTRCRSISPSIAYDRREAGQSGGRVEPLTWKIYAQHAKLLLEHLAVETFIRARRLHGCWRWRRSSLALFGIVHRPDSGAAGRRPSLEETYACVLQPSHRLCSPSWPRRGSRSRQRPEFHARSGNRAVGDQHHERSSICRSLYPSGSRLLSEAWSSKAATRCSRTPSSRVRRPRSSMPIDVAASIWPGDDASHSTSSAEQLRELLPRMDYWDLHPDKQTAENMLSRIVDFKEIVATRGLPPSPPMSGPPMPPLP